MTERANFKDSIRRLAAEVIPNSTESTATPEPVAEARSEPAEIDAQPKMPVKRQPGSAKPRRSQFDSEPNVISVTTRYPKEIDSLITKASFAQRMKDRSPGTKQDILVEAARDWLRRNGYLRHDDSRLQHSDEESKAA